MGRYQVVFPDTQMGSVNLWAYHLKRQILYVPVLKDNIEMLQPGNTRLSDESDE